MNIFDFRNRIIADYAAYVNSFIAIRDERIQQRVKAELDEGFLWPEPSIGFQDFAFLFDTLVALRRPFHPDLKLSEEVVSKILCDWPLTSQTNTSAPCRNSGSGFIKLRNDRNCRLSSRTVLRMPPSPFVNPAKSSGCRHYIFVIRAVKEM